MNVGRGTDIRLFAKNYHFFLYAAFLLVTILWFFMTMPIIAGDTDTWFHLSVGKYIAQHHEIPKHSYFSFITPPKDGIDYYWLFQLTLYGAYALAADNGLIALRAALYMATVLMLFGFIFRGRLRNNDSLAYLTAVFVLCTMVLLVRDMVLRPHMFNYLYIITFLYIIEYRPKMLVFLPLLALLWCNMHGIEYPVLILITLSYVIERYADRLRTKTAFTTQDRIYVVALIASIGAVYLTPDPVRLIGLPFQPIQYAATYIGELRTLTLADILSFNISPHIINHLTVNNLAIATVLLSVLAGIARMDIRISHMLLFGGAVVLLTKGSRFITEFVLLSLPVVVNHVPLSAGGLSKALRRPVYIMLIAMMMAIPFVFLKTFKGLLTGYPYNPVYNPRGITRFLNSIEAGGNVMSEATVGGYLIWQLYPKYRIYMDLDMTSYFSDEDFYWADNVFFNAEVLRKFIAAYKPSFFIVPLHNKAFAQLLMAYPSYKAVFFDDVAVLYVNSAEHPAIAQQYELRAVDPFSLLTERTLSLNKAPSEAFVSEIQRVYRVEPSLVSINTALASTYIARREHEKALPHAEVVIGVLPTLSIGHRLKGEALTGLQRYKEAIAAFEMAVKVAEMAEKPSVYQKISTCYSRMSNYKEAYNALKLGVNAFSVETSYVDLYNLALLALINHKNSEALMFFKFAYIKVPPQDALWQEKIKTQLAKFTD
ncbi:MAG: hypothetical protein HQL05_05625 [Nitrospirae bacterium]|uniref:tetratricopeptide repeat protein n=1 Tax=Candidatus Magnetobacterium casense TaxID=1455061 RepID=UPI00058B35FF|nr:hypothetical protein [Candidatus Magnetobacterium casensis]MBF0337293.1 hypothetical protein [Nitrospirota bacterium]